MNSPINLYFKSSRSIRVQLAALFALMFGFASLQAQPTIVSTVPASGATGVSATTTVVFTFSEAMDTANTSASFINFGTFTPVPVTSAWSAGNTVLTCSPTPSFPTNTEIFWIVSGQNPGGTGLGGNPGGTFTTAGSGGGGTGGGSGTNQFSSFSLGKAFTYNQASTAAPTADLVIPYLFIGNIELASNRAGLSATLTLPNSTISNLTQNPQHHEQFFLSQSSTNQAALDNLFGDGNYIYTVGYVGSNQTVALNFPSTLTQPNAPHITNYAATQAVDTTKAFTFGWDAFSGGTATNFVYVAIGDNFATPQPGSSNALPGTATSIVIPANTLLPNTNYDVSLTFFRGIIATNNPAYQSVVYRDSITHFTLLTTGATVTVPRLTNSSWNGHTFSFDVTSAAGQNLVVQYATSLASNQWQTLVTTNSASGKIHVSDSAHSANPQIFYRARTAP